MQPSGQRGLDRHQPRVQRRPALARGDARQLAPEVRIGGRRRIEAAEQCPHVQPGAADHHRQPAAAPDVVDRSLGVGAEAGGVVAIVGIDEVDQVVRHRSLLVGAGLAGRQVHPAVDLP